VLKKRRVLTMVSVAIVSFLIGTMFSTSFMALASDENGVPFAKIWEAIYDLQGRVENIEEQMNGASGVDFEEFINEISRVELIYLFVGAEPYYWYGVSGHWNVTKLQTEPFEEKLDSTIGGALVFCESRFVGTNWKPEWKGYERVLQIYVDRELNPTEIEEVRLLIEEYLAKP